jgi:hypothetical protein
VIKFIGVAILLIVPVAASAIDVLPHDRPDSYSASHSASAATAKLTTDNGFSPQDGVAEWRPVAPTAKAATYQQNRIDWTWAIFGMIGLTVGSGGFLIGRRNSPAGEAPQTERRRTMATVQFDENEPGFAGMAPRRTGKVASMVTTGDGETFGVFLKRASLLAGKGSGPDIGRC